MIKAFFFDYHGVIAKDGSAKRTLLYLGKGKIDKEEVKERWEVAKVGFKDQLKDYCKDIVSEKKYLQEFKRNTIFWDSLEDSLSELSKKYKLCVLSNHIPQILDYVIKECNLEKYFKEIIVSCNNLQKPQKEFFELALKKMNVSPKESVFIDDKLENIETAKQMGFVTIWLNNSITAKHNPPELVKKVIPDYTIKDFKEIIGIEKHLN
jgi:HAD superfamily hydrolase (TIGR01509 family)